jgi:maltose alpha-D-glucosyltransferase/alpha-amylase
MKPEFLKDLIVYQIYPQSYLDTDSDGIGNLQGVIQKLDYIQSLGVNAIWFNPCFESAFFDAGYDVSDYYKIASRYGSNDDMSELIKKAKAKGIRIFLDLVAGHTSIEHPNFKESCKGADNEYADCYIWKNRDYDVETGPTPDNYLQNFFPEQPALNYGFAKISEDWHQGINEPWPMRNREELKNILKFWFDMGISGFRVDMAASLIKYDDDEIENRKLWREIRSWMDKEYPESILIAEWGYPEHAIDAGYHMDFMMHCCKLSYTSLFFNEVGTWDNNKGVCYFDSRGEASPNYFIEEYTEQWKAVKGKGFISMPTANHDFQRLNCGPRTFEQLRPAWVFLMTQAGVPTIYYGDEIGMRFNEKAPTKEGSKLFLGPDNPKGERSGSRTPMQWTSGKNAGFSDADEDKLYLPVDLSDERISVETQENDPNSLLNFVRNLTKLRKNNSALGAESEIEFLNPENKSYPLVYKRFNNTQSFIIAVNPSGKTENFTYNIPNEKYSVTLQENCDIDFVDKTLNVTMKEFSFIIIELK